jgi:hypothetical protein
MKIVLIAVTAMLALAIESANATPAFYTFTTDASVTAGPSILLTGEYTEGLSGGFRYDPATDKMTDVDIIVTGPGPESGAFTSNPISTYKDVPPFIYSGGYENNPGGIEEFLLGDGGGTEIFIGFSEDNSGLPNALAYFNYNDAYFQVLPSKTYVHSVTGGVEVPEPSSLAMFVVGLAGLTLVVGIRRGQRAGC